MKWLIIFCLLLAGCTKEPRVVYRIPVEKQEAAAKLLVELTQHTGYRDASDTSWLISHARVEVEHIYGEPVVIK